MNTLYNKASSDPNQEGSITNIDKDDFKMIQAQETKDVSDELDQEIAKLKSKRSNQVAAIIAILNYPY